MNREKGLLRIDPSFRMVALAVPPTTKNNWMTAEVLEMYAFHEMPKLSPQQLLDVAKYSLLAPGDVATGASTSLATERHLVSLLTGLDSHHASGHTGMGGDDSYGDASHIELNLRQLKRILRQQQATASTEGSTKPLHTTVTRAILGDFFPPALRESLSSLLDSAGIPSAHAQTAARLHADAEPAVASSSAVEYLEGDSSIRIGSEIAAVATPQHPELVPQTRFYNIPSHITIMETMLADWARGERYSLLIGNQGTGKNKITDRLLQLLRLEREYLQLHRDTTIPHLTTTPTLVDGVSHNVVSAFAVGCLPLACRMWCG